LRGNYQEWESDIYCENKQSCLHRGAPALHSQAPFADGDRRSTTISAHRPIRLWQPAAPRAAIIQSQIPALSYIELQRFRLLRGKFFDFIPLEIVAHFRAKTL
jgi:hypothetical protein